MIDIGASWQDAALAGRRIGHLIEAHASIGSTNDRARELLAVPGADGVVVVAEEQTAGRGRRGRAWLSPSGRSLAVSAAVRPSLAARDAWQLGPSTALATAAACDAIGPVGLKWPNDVVTDRGRKVGGILIETLVDGEALSGAVIGVGLNVNWRSAEMPDEIRDAATSLADLAGHEVDPVALLSRLLDALSDEITRAERGESPLERYRRRCTTLGQTVDVAVGNATIRGRAVDLDPLGALIVEAVDGRHVLSSGEMLHVREAGR
ncbi:MAG: biotin--[acetyl-CoA-carboxylase] ligase [Candidatus Limnocylindria bacterium]